MKSLMEQSKGVGDLLAIGRDLDLCCQICCKGAAVHCDRDQLVINVWYHRHGSDVLLRHLRQQNMGAFPAGFLQASFYLTAEPFCKPGT